MPHRGAVPTAEPGDRIEFVPAEGVAGLEVARIDARARIWRWYHDTYSVMTPLVSLETSWRYRNRLYDTGRSTVALTEPGEVHREIRKGARRDVIRVLFFQPAVVEAAARELGLRADAVHWRHAQVDRREVYDLVMRLHRSLENGASVLERQSRVTHLLHVLLGEFSCGTPRTPKAGAPEPIRRARALLEERWDENVSLDELTAVSGLGRFRLVRAFHAAVGLPPHAYQLRVRVSRAMARIRRGMPLVQVASETGFADQSHLARHFRHAIGVSPGRYRGAAR